jgi:hypothetical protein
MWYELGVILARDTIFVAAISAIPSRLLQTSAERVTRHHTHESTSVLRQLSALLGARRPEVMGRFLPACLSVSRKGKLTLVVCPMCAPRLQRRRICCGNLHVSHAMLAPNQIDAAFATRRSGVRVPLAPLRMLG